jgi:hypothetical protein
MAVKAYIETLLIADIPGDAAQSKIQLPPGVNYGMRRGIVESVGLDVPVLEPGMLVYYCNHDHPKVGDATVIGAGCVHAYEEA